jgi:hypothetical protein
MEQDLTDLLDLSKNNQTVNILFLVDLQVTMEQVEEE